MSERGVLDTLGAFRGACTLLERSDQLSSVQVFYKAAKGFMRTVPESQWTSDSQVLTELFSTVSSVWATATSFLQEDNSQTTLLLSTSLFQYAVDLLWLIPSSAIARLTDNQRLQLAAYSHEVAVHWLGLKEFETAHRASTKALDILPNIQQVLQPNQTSTGSPTDSTLTFNNRLLSLHIRASVVNVQALFSLGQQLPATALLTNIVTTFNTLTEESIPTSYKQFLVVDTIKMLLAVSSCFVLDGNKGGSLDAAEHILAAAHTLHQQHLTACTASGAIEGFNTCNHSSFGRLHVQILKQQAFCQFGSDNPQQALNYLHTIKTNTTGGSNEDEDDIGAHVFTHGALLKLGKPVEAANELLGIVAHEDASAELSAWVLAETINSVDGSSSGEQQVDEVVVKSVRDAVETALKMGCELYPEEAFLETILVQHLIDNHLTNCNHNSGSPTTASATTNTGLNPLSESIIVDLITEERVIEFVMEDNSLREDMLSMLWNYGVSLTRVKQWQRALQFYEAVEVFVSGNDEEALLELSCGKALCFCGLQKFERASEVLAIPYNGDGSSICSLESLKYKVLLAMQNGEEAAQLLPDFINAASNNTNNYNTADILKLAAMEAVDADQPQVAQHALRLLLDHSIDTNTAANTNTISTTTSEAIIYQNLIHLSLHDVYNPKQEAQQAVATAITNTAQYYDMLVERLHSVGAAAFFSPTGDPNTQDKDKTVLQASAVWFAAEAWNTGIHASTIGMLQSAVVLLGSCGELCAYLGASDGALQQKQKMAFLMAGSGALDVHRDNPKYAESLSLAKQYLGAAKTALYTTETNADRQGDDDRLKVYLCLQEFALAVRQGDVEKQLSIVAGAKALPSFKADNFLTMADLGTEEGYKSDVACKAALESAFDRLSNEATLDYIALSKVMRGLVKLASSEEELLKILDELKGIVSTAPKGSSYPTIELQWVATTVWNRGCQCVYIGNINGGKQLMQAAMSVGGGDVDHMNTVMQSVM